MMIHVVLHSRCGIECAYDNGLDNNDCNVDTLIIMAAAAVVILAVAAGIIAADSNTAHNLQWLAQRGLAVP